MSYGAFESLVEKGAVGKLCASGTGTGFWTDRVR